MLKPTKTHAVTHSSVFSRIYGPDAWSPTMLCAKWSAELLHGEAAQSAFVALFDDVSDFSNMAREAAQEPVPRLKTTAATRQADRQGRFGPRRMGPSGQPEGQPPRESRNHRSTHAA